MRSRLTCSRNAHIINSSSKRAAALFSRSDILVIVAALALALLIYLVMYFYRASQAYDDRVEIYVDGELYSSAYLGVDEQVTIERDGMKNVLRITEDGFYMEYSSCKNQLCVNQGIVTKQNCASRELGAHIICLPNRVDVRLASAEGASDA